MKKKKLVLIGWDAADWQIIRPLLEEGKMPALEKLMESGSSGNLATLNPPLSPILWTSIATGKRAYDHGILGFVETDLKNGTVQAVKATTRKVKTFWNILNEAGLKTNIINWWPSHPAEEVEGVCVSNFYHKDARHISEPWELDKNSVYPQEYYEVLKELRLHPAELTLQHIMPFIPEAFKLDPERDKVLKPLLRVLAQCSSVHNATTYLMENTEWDVTAVYHEAIDHFSHLAMKYHPPKQQEISDEDFNLYKHIIEAAYRFHDMMLDRLMTLAGPDCHFMLISDHGFQSGKLRVAELPDVPAAPAVEHRKYGIFVASGPCFKKETLYGSSLLDITPAILHLFDLPIGEDMEGSVPLSIFPEQARVSNIPSWEATGPRPKFVTGKAVSDHAALKQLEELGYIDLPEKDKMRYVEYELRYNLCVSLADGDKWTRAIDEAGKLFGEFKDGRSALLLADILLKSDRFEELDTHLKELKKEHEGHPQLLYLEALQKLYTGKLQEAQVILMELEKKGIQSVQLFNEIGRAYLLLGRLNRAEEYFGKTLILDGENAPALTGWGQCKAEGGDFEEAIEILEKSLQQLFFQPNAHYLMGLSLHKLGYNSQAVTALQLAINQAPKHEKAKKLLALITEKNPREEKEAITVVTGLPRSGTSMLMQMLKMAGMDVLADEQRVSDEHNPLGYMEYEPVKSLGSDAGWIENARGKVLKVISILLRYLPATERYKLIYVKRPLTEVIVSQQIMRGEKKEQVMQNFPFQLAVDLQSEEERLATWINMQAHIEVLEVGYYDCIESPAKVLQIISDFLGVDLDIKNGSAAIDQKLHRNKLGK